MKVKTVFIRATDEMEDCLHETDLTWVFSEDAGNHEIDIYLEDMGDEVNEKIQQSKDNEDCNKAICKFYGLDHSKVLDLEVMEYYPEE